MGQKLRFLVVLSFLFIVFSMACASAETFKQGDCVELKAILNGTSWANLSTVSYPNSTILYINEAMTQRGPSYNYTFCNTEALGSYVYDFYDDTGNVYSDSFTVTYSGIALTIGKAILYIGFLALLILVFVINFVGMSMLPARNTRDEGGKLMSISYLKYFRNVLWMSGYFLFLAILYIASNLSFAFLEEQLMAKTLFMIFQVELALFPVLVIVWVIWIFATIFHDLQFQKMLNRGMFEEGQF